MNPVGWILGLGLVATLYLLLPLIAIVIVALLIVRRGSRRFGALVAACTLVSAVVIAPWMNWGFDGDGISLGLIIWVLVLYVGQVAIPWLVAGFLFRLCLWLWRRLAPLFSTTHNQQ
jgi:hypothetical protein